MYDCASSIVVYHILPLTPQMTDALWMVHYGFHFDLFDIPCIGGLFGCDAITSWLVMKVVNIEMRSDNTS
jgi:hypothetical protein